MESEDIKFVKIYLEKGSLKVRSIVDKHQLIVDLPEKYGGSDQSPDPYAYLLTTL